MATTSWGTRKALGRRYATDPAMELELERLRQEYNLAPGREARGLQAAQFASSQAQNESQFARNLALQQERDAQQIERDKQAGTAAMVGSIGNVASGAATTYMLGKAAGLWGTQAPAAAGATGATAGTGMGIGSTVTPTFTVNPALALSSEAAGGSAVGATGAALAGQEAGAAAASGISAGTGATSGTTGATIGGAGISTGLSYLGPAAVGYSAPGLVNAVFGKGSTEQLGKNITFGLPMGDKERSYVGSIGAGAAAGAAVGSVVPVVGTAVGAIIGGIGGAIAEATGTVLCTELLRQGKLDPQIYEKECVYVDKHITNEEYIGYRIIADPVVKIMRKSEKFTYLISPLIRAFAMEMASRIDAGIKGSRLGKVILKVGLPVCRYVFRTRRREYFLEVQ